jgi:hypothetical protein
MAEPTIVVGLESGDRVRVQAARVEEAYDGTIKLFAESGTEVGKFPTGVWAVRAGELVE